MHRGHKLKSVGKVHGRVLHKSDWPTWECEVGNRLQRLTSNSHCRKEKQGPQTRTHESL